MSQTLLFIWKYDSPDTVSSVCISGSWDGWATKTPLEWFSYQFQTTLTLPLGVHQFKFYITYQDSSSKYVYDMQLPTCDDGCGGKNNACLVRESQRSSGLSYHIWRPRLALPGGNPVIFFLHGAGEICDGAPAPTHGPGHLLSVADMKIGGPPDEATSLLQDNFYVVCPQCPAGDHWSYLGSPLLSLLKHVLDTNPGISRARVCITGLSMGGYAAWRLAMENPELFACCVPICGGYNIRKSSPSLGPSLARLPIRAFHCDLDAVVPLEESCKAVEWFQRVGGGKDVELTIFHTAGKCGTHDAWSVPYSDPQLYSWMLEQSLR